MARARNRFETGTKGLFMVSKEFHLLITLYKKMIDFPGRVWLVTFRLGTGKSLTFLDQEWWLGISGGLGLELV
jgi:hypothetical protein